MIRFKIRLWVCKNLTGIYGIGMGAVQFYDENLSGLGYGAA